VRIAWKIAAWVVLALAALPATASHSVTTTVVPNACNAQCNATATAVVTGGSGAFAYQWSTTPAQSTATATGLCAGTYLVVVSDLVNGDQVPAFAIVNDPAPLAVFFSHTDALCASSCDGSVSATAAGGTGTITYAWSTGGTASSISNVCAGTYSLTVTDANACQLSSSASVAAPPALAAAAAPTDARSSGACNGSVALAVTGGVTPNNVQWTLNGAPFTTQTATCSTATSCSAALTGLCTGTYAAHTIDQNNCSTDASTTIASALTANPDSATTASGIPVSLSVVANDTETFGSGVAIDPATVDLDPATPGVQSSFAAPGAGTFSADAAGTVTFTPLATFAGIATRTYTVNDNGGFVSNAAAIAITVSAPAISLAPAALPAAQVGIAYSQALSASGGTAPYSFTVTSGALPAGLSLSSGGTLAGTTTAVAAPTPIVVTATDANGFTGSASYTIASLALTSFTGASPTGSGNITASFTGGGAGCTFAAPPRFIPVVGDPRSPPAGSAPSGVVFPHGLLDFTTSGCTAGSALAFTIAYPAALPAGTRYWKYGPRPGPLPAAWYVLPATLGGSTATFTIVDGALGDDDLLVNGGIVDQGGPGGGPGGGVPTSVPTLSEWMLIALGALLVAIAVAFPLSLGRGPG
jgi:hypothetical protein